ncbi:MAG: branched-chain amino acid ABC transporter permease [Methylobacterium frigidaeris]
MALLLQQILDGLAAGAIYGALALALTLIYRATRIVNFGQGEMATFSAYLAWQLDAWGVPVALGIPIVLIASFVLGAAVFALCIRPIWQAPQETIVVATLGLFLVFQALCLLVWGAEQHAFPRLMPDRAWILAGGGRVTGSMLGTVGVLVVLAVSLWGLLRFTRTGLALRAAALEGENSVLVGIRVEFMLMLGWGLAAAIGFVAAVLVAPSLFLAPAMMVPVLVYALAAATLGGWTSPLGAIVGGLVIGVAESVSATFLPFVGADLRLLVPIALTLAVLLVRPAGLFGKHSVVRA